MSVGHSEASFNHSCLKVPVDSSSRKPFPKYERLSTVGNTIKKETETGHFPVINYDNLKSVKSYLEFYESIPDYTELHHLSNEEFYFRLKSLKITQKRFCAESGLLNSNNEEKSFVDKLNGSWEDKKSDGGYGAKSHHLLCHCCDWCAGKNDHLENDSNTFTKTSNDTKTPKISVTSDNDHLSETFGSEIKRHSDYETDQESSTLQIARKTGTTSTNLLPVNRDFCRRQYQLVPRGCGCGCDAADICHDITKSKFGNDKYSFFDSCYSMDVKNSKDEKSKQVHHRPVPLTSRIPLFDKIMIEKEARRRTIHERYSKKLRSLVQPFSFTKKEEASERHRMVRSNPELTSAHNPTVRFKAKPIPKNLFSDYAYEKMKEDELYRALKRRIRAEEMLKSSSLPPSMALREKKFLSKSLDYIDYESPGQSWNKGQRCVRGCGYLKKLTSVEEKCKCNELRRGRRGWLFGNGRTNSITDSSTEISPYESVVSESKPKSRPYSAYSSSRGNLASVLRIETARKRLEKEMEEKLRKSRLKDEAKFKARIIRMTPAWKALKFDKKEDLELRVAARREEERLKQEKYQQLMETMYGRVYRMPPLFHNERFTCKKNSKTKLNKDRKFDAAMDDPVCVARGDGTRDELLEAKGKSDSPDLPLSTGLPDNLIGSGSSIGCGKNYKKTEESCDTSQLEE